jgi:hypothetical protein
MVHPCLPVPAAAATSRSCPPAASGPWSFGIDPLTRRRRYLRATCKTRAEAEKELTRLRRDVDRDKHSKSAITVAEAVAQ